MAVAANIWPVLASGAQVGQLDKIKGPVTVTRSDGEKIEGRANLSLMPGDQIETGKGGEVAFTLEDGDNFKLGEEAQVTVDELSGADTEEGQPILRLVLGYLWSKISLRDKQAGAEIHTPTAIVGVRGTEFDTVASIDAASVVTVDEGRVEVSIEKESVLVEKGKMTQVEMDGKPAPPAAAVPRDKRNWQAWRQERGQRLLKNLPKMAPRLQKNSERAAERLQDFSERVNKRADEIQKTVKMARQAMAERDRKKFTKARNQLQAKVPQFRKMAGNFRRATNRVRGLSRLSKRVEGFAAKNKDRYSPEEIAGIDSSLAVISKKRAELKQIFQSTIPNIKQTFEDLREFKRTVGAQRGRQTPPSGRVPPQRRQRGR